MEIIIAENSGLCYGVKRALTIARRTRETRPGPVATLGDLIHNPGVIADLERRGIRSAVSPGDIKDGTVILRSHGVSPEMYERLELPDLRRPYEKVRKVLFERIELPPAAGRHGWRRDGGHRRPPR